ncbi:MAG: type II secretion system F family protein, partial [Eubacterium sp.]|nr:type II secretion system F family protein [Eubacterium sp.]
YASDEAQAILTKEMQYLDTAILGKNQSLGRIEWNLQLPDTLGDSGITVTWSTDRPDLVGWDGVLSDNISKSGEKVTLTGILRLSDTEEAYQRVLTVFPSREERALQERIQKESDELNRKAVEEGTAGAGEYLLPESADGQKLTWYKRTEHKGAYLCLLILLAGVAPFFTGKEKKEKEEQKRRKLLTRQYPELISKLQLLTAAGLSVRKAMERLAKEYPEIACTVAEMHNGVYEQDALARFGERCGTPEYRKLALLLVQSQKKGGSQLAVMLEKEVQDAFETRKRKARTEGERSTIRMLFPMFMMLGIVLILIIIPSLMEL